MATGSEIWKKSAGSAAIGIYCVFSHDTVTCLVSKGHKQLTPFYSYVI
jgi:hypothetical protein